MKIKTLLFAIVATLVVLPSCKKTDKNEPTVEPVVVNEFTDNLTLAESALKQNPTDVKSALIKAGFEVAEGTESPITAVDTVGKVAYAFSAAFDASNSVYNVNLEMTSADKNSFVADGKKLGEAIIKVGQNHKFPSGLMLGFSDFSVTKEGEQAVTGHTWGDVTPYLNDMSKVTNLVMNWTNADGKLSIIDKVTAEGYYVKFMMNDYSK